MPKKNLDGITTTVTNMETGETANLDDEEGVAKVLEPIVKNVVEKLDLESNPKRIDSTELFVMCQMYKKHMNDIELLKAGIRAYKDTLKPIMEAFKALEGKEVVIFKEGSETEKIELAWEIKVTPANEDPKPTEEKTKYIPIIKEG